MCAIKRSTVSSVPHESCALCPISIYSHGQSFDNPCSLTIPTFFARLDSCPIQTQLSGPSQPYLHVWEEWSRSEHTFVQSPFVVCLFLFFFFFWLLLPFVLDELYAGWSRIFSLGRCNSHTCFAITHLPLHGLCYLWPFRRPKLFSLVLSVFSFSSFFFFGFDYSNASSISHIVSALSMPFLRFCRCSVHFVACLFRFDLQLELPFAPACFSATIRRLKAPPLSFFSARTVTLTATDIFVEWRPNESGHNLAARRCVHCFSAAWNVIYSALTNHPLNRPKCSCSFGSVIHQIALVALGRLVVSIWKKITNKSRNPI